MFIIRVRDGLTSTLKKRVLEKGTCQVPVLLEGPYGGPPDITPFTTCVFIAGMSANFEPRHVPDRSFFDKAVPESPSLSHGWKIFCST